MNKEKITPRFDRGYTGHEYMCGFGLINMNGRLYDPYVQRFLSPDNVVQKPDNAQNYNRYSYCLNNPLMYTDPTGWMSVFQSMYHVWKYSLHGGFWNSGDEYPTFFENENDEKEYAEDFLYSGGDGGDGFGGSFYFVGAGVKSFTYVIGVKGKGTRGYNNYIGTEKVPAHYVWIPSGLSSSSNSDFSFWSALLQGNVEQGQRGFDDIPLNSAVGMGERIVGIANGYIGSTDYNLLSKQGDFLPGNPKCNKFVYDVLLQAGASPGLPNQPGRWGMQGPKPPIAAQWANANYNIHGWVVVSSPMPGDVASFSGHVGIVFGNGLTISATLSDGVVRNNWGFRTGQTPVFRRFVGYSPYFNRKP